MTSIGLHLDSGSCPADPAVECRHDDATLLRGLQAGENSAYEELVHRFQQPVYNLVSRLMADPDDAGDVVQEVFLKVFRSIGNFRGQSSLKTWIYRIAVNEGYNHRRWFSRHRKQEVGLDAEIEGTRTYQDILPDPTRSPFDSASDHETQALIGRGLEGLNPKFRAAVVLRDIEDLSYEEIAEVLQVSLGTVKSRILRGREALREALVARMAERTAHDAEPVAWWPQMAE